MHQEITKLAFENTTLVSPIDLFTIALLYMTLSLLLLEKLVTLNLLKITQIWSKVNEVIISVDGVTDKILSSESNSIIDLVM